MHYDKKNTGWPKKHPIFFLITTTKIKQNQSNFVYLNFCLCMIVPQSISILGCFAQKLCSLRICSKWPRRWETNLYLLRKIVNYSQALLSGDFPDFCYNCNQSLTIVWGLLWYTLPFRYPLINSGSFKSGEWGAHSMSHSCWSAISEIALSASQGCDLMCGGRPVLLEPLFITINPSASSEWHRRGK